jgi:putative two-component system response regulator
MVDLNAAWDPAAEVIRHLRELEARGSNRLVAQLIDSLMSESSGQMEAVRHAASDGDRERLYRAAHSLQGSVAIAGGDSVARLCAELVKTARGGSFEQIDTLVAQVESGIDIIRKSLVGWTETQSIAMSRPVAPPRPLVTRKRVLVIDDDDGMRRITQMLVESIGHDVELARDGIEGLAKLQLGVDLVLLDVVMPGLDGFDVCRRIRQDPLHKDVPVIMVTTLETKEHRLHAVEAGANDFIAKPVDETELRVRTSSVLKMKETQDELKRYHARLEEMVETRTTSLRRALEQMAEAQRVAYQSQLETVERLAILAEYKDKVTARHIHRMSEYCAIIARGLKLPPAEVELILHGSRMHDLGKIAVPEAILQKPSGLDPDEWKVMRQHSSVGSAMLENSSSHILQAGRVMAQHHHERWDGSGYPSGLAGSDIPLWGRICAVADVFDAVTSERPYKPAFPNEEALQLLRDGRGTHFDPRVVDVFFERLPEVLVIQEKYKDDRTDENTQEVRR